MDLWLWISLGAAAWVVTAFSLGQIVGRIARRCEGVDDFGMQDGLCAKCRPKGEPEPTWGGTVPRERGYCIGCGFFFDQWGMRLLSPTLTCREHSPIKASCPHSGSLQ
jgi:hypothetical protein